MKFLVCFFSTRLVNLKYRVSKIRGFEISQDLINKTIKLFNQVNTLNKVYDNFEFTDMFRMHIKYKDFIGK